ncbi:hypothetical protein B0G57_112149 [Trinickia symbiotica]|uniref:Uncharacterized protein n=1 Tax=Trinickia symbiotica TaxID=863227 RepID=A0A2N7X0I8_9BURK|nr:hypothetical protein C0Z20_20340 [Trinickia symbiotica]PPK43602.1 hypothetical protein B0G57_112149 [Trinickia symbiotica]
MAAICPEEIPWGTASLVVAIARAMAPPPSLPDVHLDNFIYQRAYETGTCLRLADENANSLTATPFVAKLRQPPAVREFGSRCHAFDDTLAGRFEDGFRDRQRMRTGGVRALR